MEFKVIGGCRPAKAYVTDGMVRFADGRYAPYVAEGAMWAFFLPGSSEAVSHLKAIIDKHLGQLGCQAEDGNLPDRTLDDRAWHGQFRLFAFATDVVINSVGAHIRRRCPISCFRQYVIERGFLTDGP